ncbi:MAG: hypothetical protein ABF449_05440, partial [Ethanoligenens sp.]
YKHCKENIVSVAQKYRWSKISEPIIEFCKNPIHTHDLADKNGRSAIEKTSVVYEEKGNSHSTGSELAPVQSRRARRGSVQQTLYEIEQQQIELQKTMRHIARDGSDANERLAELQTWSYMMNDRFNKFKGFANPFKFLKRLFRRR